MKKTTLTILSAAILSFAIWSMTAFAASSVIMGGNYQVQKAGPSAAQNTEISTVVKDADPQIGKKTAETFSVEKINVPDSAQVLVVLSAEKNANSGTLQLYKKNGAAGQLWTKALSTKAMIGKNGLYKEKEGDCKTPVGIFKMNTPFGIKEALDGFPANYVKVDKSHYWVGDNQSPMYNKFVSTNNYSSFSKKDSEHIIDYGAYYNYCIDSGYNPDCVPYKGSAIYLHCVVGGQDTHGCIAIPESDMIEVMKAYQEGNTYIAIYDLAAPAAVLKK